MIIGFTGTRSGMTKNQLDRFVKIFIECLPTEFHHGCCLGSDAEAVETINRITVCQIHAHPGKSAKDKPGKENEDLDDKSLELSNVVHPTLGHFARNRVIVNTCDLLIAAPWQSKEHEPPEGSGGGTWMTVQYAVKIGKLVKIMWSDGTVEAR